MNTESERLDLINIEDEMQRAYIDYSMSVIIGRALPDARDGLKPGNRRILYAMQAGGWTHSKPYVKCARVVGDVIGKYHPHGDSAVYDTLVRMAQDFSMRCLLINGQGNFGSIDGDRPAAYRYTECRLMPQAEEMLADIEKNTVEMRPNYDETQMEPLVLPARIPNLLVNGSTGIAVGMATNIPPHNLGEIVDATIYLIDHPDADIANLCRLVKGPDFPTGGIIQGLSGIQAMYATGRGRIRLRGRAEIEEEKGGRERIVITEIPYAVNKAALVTKMAELVREKKIDGISDIRDESGKQGLRVVVELKKGAIGKVVLNNIYQHTQLASTFGAIMLAIDRGRPRIMNLKELLQCFIDHRFEVITRRTRFDLEKAEARAHILEGLLIALDRLDEVVKTIRESKNRDEAEGKLMKRFGLSEIQAKAILDMRLYQLTGLEREKVETEYKDVQKLIVHLRDLLANEDKLYGVIKADLAEIKTRFDDPRRTEIQADEDELAIEDLIADEPCVITLSHAGYIKRVPIDTYREQRRGGKGVIGMDTKEEDFVEHVFSASTHDYLLCFTATGRLYWLKAWHVPEGSRQARGRAIANLLEMDSEEKLAALIQVRDFGEDRSLLMATRKGIVKKTILSAFRNIRAGGIRAISIDDDDRLIGVELTAKGDEVMLSTHGGQSIRFSEKQVRNMGRSARGVKGITLTGDDQVVSIEKVDPEGTVLVVTENGYGKRTEFAEYRAQSRGGKGIITIQTTERNGGVVGAYTVKDGDSLIVISEGGQTIRFAVSDVSVIGRNTQGVRLFSLPEGDKLISAAIIAAGNDGENPVDDESTADNAPEQTGEGDGAAEGNG